MRNVKTTGIPAFFLTALLGIIFHASTVRAALRDLIEPMVAEVTIALKSGDYAETLRLTQQILEKDPNAVQALEMRAMALKASGQTQEASKAYLDLVKKRWKNGDKDAVAPYYFELGSLRLKDQKLEEAKFYFERTVEWNFNPTVSRFFLGNVQVQQKDFNGAMDNFEFVANGEIADLKPPAEFFLAQIAFKRKKPAIAVGHLQTSRQLAKAAVENPASTDETRGVAKKLIDTADKALAPLDQASFFGSISLVTGYDSNVLSVPTSQASTPEGTGDSSMKETLAGAVGYATSPLGQVQLVPSYRLSYNYNFNKATRTGSFLTQTLSVITTADVLVPISYGMKTEGTLTFQNQPEPITDNSLYKPYALSGAIGPFFKWDQNLMTLTAEIAWQPQRNFGDSSTSESLQRSGNEGVARVGARLDQGNGWANPAVSFTYDINHTKGIEYRSKTVGILLSDTIYFSETISGSPSLSYSGVKFSERASGERRDKLWVFGMSGSWRLTESFTGIADLQTMRNASTEPASYEFNRTTLSAGISYSF